MYRFLSLLTLVFFFTACGGGSEESVVVEDRQGNVSISYENDQGEKEDININLDDIDLDQAKEGIADVLDQMSESLRDGEGSGGESTSMNYKDLKDILPSRLVGLRRTDHTGEQGGALGMSISQAEATYRDDDQKLEVSVVDMGTGGLAKLSLAAVNNLTVHREGDFGYERTIELEGYKAFEKWDADSRRGELVWAYKDRYLITLKGRELNEDALRKALRRIDYDDLD